MTGLFSALPAEAIGLAVALGAGLLIGLERERRKGHGADRAAAGLRTFMVASLAGALAASARQPGLVAVATLGVAALAALSYWRSSGRDPGLTTELALVVTCLIGALAVAQPALAAAAATLLAALLAARERLHRFATRVLTEAELHDALWLAAVALVLLPLMSSAPQPWLGGARPRTLVALVVLILLLQAAGHVALRLAGPRAGLALAGLCSGFVSSTATIASMGARARADAAQRAGFEAGALLSTAATWCQALLVLGAISRPLALALAPAAAAGAVVAAGSGWWRARTAPAGPDSAAPDPVRGPLHLRDAALVAVVLTLVSVLVDWAQQRFGAGGVLVGSAIGALADAHASIAALGALQSGGQLELQAALLGVLVAVTTNATSRCVVAFVAGGAGFGLRVSASLGASTGAAWLAWAAFGA
jgi:uncharacterized membrane protein (DUF4010 family)